MAEAQKNHYKFRCSSFYGKLSAKGLIWILNEHDHSFNRTFWLW